jgi:hypothetical protein
VSFRISGSRHEREKDGGRTSRVCPVGLRAVRPGLGCTATRCPRNPTKTRSCR